MNSLPYISKPAVKIEKNGVLHQNPFLTITQSKGIFDGFEKNYYVADFGPRAGIVAVKDGSILLSAQYRLLIDDISWELPGGRMDEGEGPVVAACRECWEETRVSCENLMPLVTYRPGLDNVENLTHIFYSESITSIDLFLPDPQESLAIAWVPLEEACSLVLSHKITDAMTVAGILAYRLTKNRLK